MGHKHFHLTSESRLAEAKQQRIVAAERMFSCHECPWVDRNSKDVFNKFLFCGGVHSINEIVTVMALIEHQKDSASVYIRDLIGLIMNAYDIHFDSNLADPEDDNEYFMLVDRSDNKYGPRRPHKYHDRAWATIWFDKDEYWEIRTPYIPAMTVFYSSLVSEEQGGPRVKLDHAFDLLKRMVLDGV